MNSQSSFEIERPRIFIFSAGFGQYVVLIAYVVQLNCQHAFFSGDKNNILNSESVGKYENELF